MKKLLLSLLLLPLFLPACPPAPVPPPVPDGGITCDELCGHLRAISCGDGFGYTDGGASCEDLCTHLEQHPIIDMKKSCLWAAQDSAAAAACGSVSCAP